MIWWIADIDQILIEAQNRWLRPAEICEILRNYKNFRMAQEPPNMPSSTTLKLHCFCLLLFIAKFKLLLQLV